MFLLWCGFCQLKISTVPPLVDCRDLVLGTSGPRPVFAPVPGLGYHDALQGSVEHSEGTQNRGCRRTGEDRARDATQGGGRAGVAIGASFKRSIGLVVCTQRA
jgi:hypothetical protein